MRTKLGQPKINLIAEVDNSIHNDFDIILEHSYKRINWNSL